MTSFTFIDWCETFFQFQLDTSHFQLDISHFQVDISQFQVHISQLHVLELRNVSHQSGNVKEVMALPVFPHALGQAEDLTIVAMQI